MAPPLTNNPGNSRKEAPAGHSGRSKRKFIFLVLCAIVAGAAAGLIYWTITDLPAVKSLEGYAPSESSLVYSSDGTLLAELYVERRTFIPYYQIPDHVKKAFIAIEDIRFYSHPGVDIIGILRALVHDVRTVSAAQGGSTITQQLAKLLFLKPEKSIIRKLKEAAISLQIEKQYTKDEILGLYLNQVYFGTRAYGIEAASQTYFGKTSNALSLAEAALLASLPKGPSLYSPFKNPVKARERRSAVLRQMVSAGFITESQSQEAEKEPLPERPHFRKYEAPYFIELLRHDLEELLGNELYTAGYRIHSTIDFPMQKAAEEALTKGVTDIEKRAKKGVQAALIAMELSTGSIRAMVGGSDFWSNQFNRATQALRQPGSAFKPFVYLAAIESGMKSGDTIIDSPITLKGSRPGQTWTPKNYDGKFYGPVTLKTALSKSLNSATIRLASHVGLDRVIDTAIRLGISSRIERYLPVALGSADVILMEMAPAYAAFATGNHVQPLYFERILRKDGFVVREYQPQVTNLLTPENVAEMKALLRAVVTDGTAQRARELKRDVFGKTGTTNEYTDAWFIGFDDNLVVGVWVGRDDHTPIGSKETGARAALPIWIDFMKKAPLRTPLE